jgi:hypothetical protein
MTMRLIIRLIIDFVMIILMLFALSYRIIGDVSHEWIGVSLFILFVMHNIINFRWYRQMFKGRYDFRRGLNTAVNLLLLAAMTVLTITGLLHSRTVLAFLHLPGGMGLRQAHTTAAYWGLLLIAVHLGLHWEMIINAMRKMTGITKTNFGRIVIICAAAVLIVVFGVWGSFDRDMFSKLFQGFSFDYWDPERPAVLFFMFNFSILGMYVFLTYYGLKFFAYLRDRKNRIKGKG